MGTRNYTIVKLDKEVKVCQYGQWDGYPTYAGEHILNFLCSSDMEVFKEKVRNVKFNVTNDDNATVTGAPCTNRFIMVCEAVAKALMENDNGMFDNCEHFTAYHGALHLNKEGVIADDALDEFMAATRDVGHDILSYIYDRDINKPPLELYSDDDDIVIGKYGAQGIYTIDLDKGKVFMEYGKTKREYSLDSLPSGDEIESEMQAFENEDRNRW